MADNIFDQIGEDDDGDEQQTSLESGIASGQGKTGKSSGQTSADGEKEKNTQEFLRQQSEEIKSLKGIVAKQQLFMDRITGSDEEAKKRFEEAKKREKWTDDPQQQVRTIVEEAEKRMMLEIDKTRSKVTMRDIAEKIGKKYDVDLDNPQVAGKVVPIIELFSKEAKLNQPEIVLEAALKLAGEAKERESMPFLEGGGGGTPAANRTAIERESEEIRNRIFGDGKPKVSNNVFGI